jgi:protein-tyrosine-phosphatase/DNA-binding transcriptional ArsR family regulator
MRMGGPALSSAAFLRLAAHPLRWRLLSELARSDRHVQELTGLLGQPQSLVSYHLGKLRGARLVSVRRSSADGRDAYYSADLTRCGELLAAAGAALHPGLQLMTPAAAGDGVQIATHVRVLFLCTGNSARSQMAEALLRAHGGPMAEAVSAGSHPKDLHPNAIRVMAERGIDLHGQRSKHLSTYAGQHFDYVISLCDKVREVCPEFPGHPELVHWSIPDPAASGATDAATYPAFQTTVAELHTRIEFLLRAAGHNPIQEAP